MARVRDRLQTASLLLLLLMAIPLGAQTQLPASAPFCFTSGSATYRLSTGPQATDYTVRVADASANPDLRMQLVDDPAEADFVLVDDRQPGDGTPCAATAAMKTVRVAGPGTTADVTISLSADPGTASGADYRLYVHSTRFSHAEAAALLAAMWKADRRQQVAVDR
jgi:hypothetical protein